MSKIPTKLHPDFQDVYFLNLDKILVPIVGKPFECMGMEIAFYIAHEYGARLDLLHVGSNLENKIDNYLEKLAKYEIEHNLVLSEERNVPRTILKFWKKYRHNLVLMSGRRRPTVFDKITMQSISSSLVSLIQSEALQIFPPTLRKMSDKLENIAVLLPYSNRDPFLLRWASAIAAPQKNANVRVYHLASVPTTVPLSGALNEEEIRKEKKIFRNYTKRYEDIFGQIIQPKFIIGHNVVKSLESIFSEDEPDLVIIGKSRQQNFWEKITKPLSSKIRDNLLNTGVCIHHML